MCHVISRFDAMDLDKNGTLSFEELMPLLCELGHVQSWAVTPEHLKGFHGTLTTLRNYTLHTRDKKSKQTRLSQLMFRFTVPRGGGGVARRLRLVRW